MLRQLEYHEEALKCFNKAIKINPEYTEAYKMKGIENL